MTDIAEDPQLEIQKFKCIKCTGVSFHNWADFENHHTRHAVNLILQKLPIVVLTKISNTEHKEKVDDLVENNYETENKNHPEISDDSKTPINLPTGSPLISNSETTLNDLNEDTEPDLNHSSDCPSHSSAESLTDVHQTSSLDADSVLTPERNNSLSAEKITETESSVDRFEDAQLAPPPSKEESNSLDSNPINETEQDQLLQEKSSQILDTHFLGKLSEELDFLNGISRKPTTESASTLPNESVTSGPSSKPVENTMKSDNEINDVPPERLEASAENILSSDNLAPNPKEASIDDPITCENPSTSVKNDTNKNDFKETDDSSRGKLRLVPYENLVSPSRQSTNLIQGKSIVTEKKTRPESGVSTTNTETPPFVSETQKDSNNFRLSSSMSCTPIKSVSAPQAMVAIPGQNLADLRGNSRKSASSNDPSQHPQQQPSLMIYPVCSAPVPMTNNMPVNSNAYFGHFRVPLSASNPVCAVPPNSLVRINLTQPANSALCNTPPSVIRMSLPNSLPPPHRMRGPTSMSCGPRSRMLANPSQHLLPSISSKFPSLNFPTCTTRLGGNLNQILVHSAPSSRNSLSTGQKRPLPDGAETTAAKTARQEASATNGVSSEPSSAKDCEILVIQRRSHGVPVIENVQGSQSGHPSLPAISGPVAANEANKNSNRNQSAEIVTSNNATTNKLASPVVSLMSNPNITVIPTANKANEAPGDQRVLELGNSSAVEPPVVSESSRRSNNYTSVTILNVTRPVRPDTIDLTSDNLTIQPVGPSTSLGPEQLKTSNVTPSNITPSNLHQPRSKSSGSNSASNRLIPSTSSSVPSQLACQVCDKLFPTPALLKSHLDLHIESLRAYKAGKKKSGVRKSSEPYSANGHGKTTDVHFTSTDTSKSKESTSKDLYIPVIDVSSTDVLNKLEALGINQFIPISNITSGSRCNTVIPIMSASVIRQHQLTSSFPGISGMMSLGTPKCSKNL